MPNMDPSIYQNAFKPTVALQDPMDSMGKAMQMKHAMQQQEAGDLDLEQKKRTMAETMAFKQDVQAAAGDPKRLKGVFLKYGKDKDWAEIEKAQRETAAAGAKLTETQGQMFASVGGAVLQAHEAGKFDVAQAAWDTGIKQAQAMGMDTSTMPPQYDPKMAAGYYHIGLSALDRYKAGEKANEPKTPLAQLEADYAAGRIKNKADYDAMKEKLTTHAPGTSVYTGSLVAGEDSGTGKPAFAMPSKDGTIKVVPGFTPPRKDKPKDKMNIEKLDAVISEAEPLLTVAPGSYAGAGVAFGKKLVGVSDESTQAQAKLRGLEAALMMNMPRMEGPQSDKDVMLYRQQAGQIGDPTIPAGDKKAALEMIKSLVQKYRVAASDQTPPATPTKKGAASVDELLSALGHK